MTGDPVNHPRHYGGEDDPFEAIKVIEAWELGFHLGNCVKYVARAGKKGAALEDLRKAAWYLQRKIDLMDPSGPALEPADAIQDAALVIARTARPRSLLDWFRTALLTRFLSEYARELRR